MDATLPQRQSGPATLEWAQAAIKNNGVSTTDPNLLGGLVHSEFNGSGGWFTQQRGLIGVGGASMNPYTKASPVWDNSRNLSTARKYATAGRSAPEQSVDAELQGAPFQYGGQ